jgi:4-hydroxy-tetrahydrodipicolinate synthase
MTAPAFTPAGVIPACLLPFDQNLEIDEENFRAHLRDLAAVDGVTAVTINAHSSEVATCSFEEQRRLMDIAADELAESLPIVHGVYADGGMEAARIAAMAERGGASALLIFPPGPFALGQRPEMALDHFRRVADASSLPLIAFQFPATTGQCYPLETLVRMAEEIPSLCAIKDWCNEVVLHQRHIRVLQTLPRPVNVLTSHSAWLLPSLAMGCKGIISGAGAVIPNLLTALFRAIQAGDLKKAKNLDERMLPLLDALYAEPQVDMHNRLKKALAMLGRQPQARVRPPLAPISPTEIGRIRKALVVAGMLDA